MDALPYHYEVLDFFHDDENSCALTILAHRTRFHVIADIDNLRDESAETTQDSGILENYLRLLDRFKVSSDDGETESPQESTDSGIDINMADSADSKPNSSAGVSAADSLYRCLVSPVESKIRKAARPREHPKSTLKDWYNLPTRFFNLQARGQKLQALELEASPDLEQRMSKLRPCLTPVPKYILSIDTPRYAASDLHLMGCTNSPPPYHPSIVELPASVLSDDKGGARQRLFFKAVDNADPQPTKREISLLHQIAKKGLHDQIRYPRLEEIVTDGASQKHIMGFLQTLIPDPTPLTQKLDSSVPQELREKWAREADRMNMILHEHGIVWGDAKGDNFMVDSSGDLWIIDFGGSYTEGWVDPEISETTEGDNMGVEKVVNALYDPDENVEGRGHGDEDQQRDDVDEKKRKRDGEERPGEPKKQKNGRRVKFDTSEAPRYCYCGGLSSGTMIGCDGPDCKKEWFHIECTDLTEVPAGKKAWFCRDCESASQIAAE